ncbi:MAG: methylated-DNA--[protein]-cysteine S-methyltransferase [Promethearchaeota archaeon]
MTEKFLAVFKAEGQYIAGIFTNKGLYTTSSPKKSKSEAIESVAGKGLKQTFDESFQQVLSTVLDIHNGKQNAKIQDIRLDLSGFTEKQVAVLRVVMQIPFGSTLAYGEVARKAGLPGAARFVGNVMRINRLGPVIPCHRVVSSTGLGGYTGGIDKKIDLLSREGVIRGQVSGKALERIL